MHRASIETGESEDGKGCFRNKAVKPLCRKNVQFVSVFKYEEICIHGYICPQTEMS
jgi:hypothetical protein